MILSSLEKIEKEIVNLRQCLESDHDSESLAPASNTDATSQASPDSPEGTVAEEFEVEKILRSKRSGRELLYLVTWKGFGEEDNSWQPAANLTGCQELVEEFHKRNPRSPKPKSLITKKR